MGYASWIVENAVKSGTVVTSSSEDPFYPRANLRNGLMAVPFRFEGIAGAGWIEFDFGEAVELDTLALFNHNFAPGVTLTLKAGSSPEPSTVIASPAYRKDDLWRGFTAATHRYWRLEIADSDGGDPSKGFTEIGELFPALRKTFTVGFAFQWSRRVERRRLTHTTNRGIAWHLRRFDRAVFEHRFEEILDSHLAELRELDEATEGPDNPLVWIPDSSKADVYLVERTDTHLERSLSHFTWEVSLELTEQSRGKEVDL